MQLLQPRLIVNPTENVLLSCVFMTSDKHSIWSAMEELTKAHQTSNITQKRLRSTLAYSTSSSTRRDNGIYCGNRSRVGAREGGWMQGDQIIREGKVNIHFFGYIFQLFSIIPEKKSGYCRSAYARQTRDSIVQRRHVYVRTEYVWRPATRGSYTYSKLPF